MSDDKFNPCEFCFYANEATDSTGHDYYQCELDDNPEDHIDAICCVEEDEIADLKLFCKRGENADIKG